MIIIVVYAHFPIYLHYAILHFPSSKSFQIGCCSFVFSSSNVSHSKQAAICSHSHFYFSAYFSLLSSMRAESFLDIVLYIKPLFPINRQFSIDSFLDCGKVITGWFASLLTILLLTAALQQGSPRLRGLCHLTVTQDLRLSVQSLVAHASNF